MAGNGMGTGLMLIALLVVLAMVCWGGMVLVYYKSEVGAWFDNRFGPDSISPEDVLRKKQNKERREARWRWYK